MNNSSKTNLLELNSRIVNCSECKRLVDFRQEIASKKRKMYKDQIYWGKPVTGFGDSNAKLMIIGLAPAAHGGNRTGRVFTGDKSSEFLFTCLNKAKISNLSTSTYKNDGLKLFNTYLTLSLKCVPPGDKPTKDELLKCFKYLKKEISYLRKVEVILSLGKIAFDSIINFYKYQYKNLNTNYNFSHGAEYKLPDKKILIGCYHPSPRNVNTKVINLKMMKNLFIKAKQLN